MSNVKVPQAHMGRANAWDNLLVSEEDTYVRRAFNGLDNVPDPADNWGLAPHEDWVYERHNTKSGRCFMIGAGPSLSEQRDLLPLLQNEDTWTVNKFRMFKPPFTPTYHGVTEPGPIGGWGSYILAIYDFPEATERIAVNWWPVTMPGWKSVNKAPDDLQVRWEGWFGCGDTLPPLPTAWASPLTFGQLACWFGYTELFYLGCDTTQVGYAWDPKNGRSKEPRSIRSIVECADRARTTMELAGRKIYDCSGGTLTQEGVLPYVDLREVLL